MEQNKIFKFHDNLSLWFSLGTGLLVMQMGSFLSGGIGTKQAFLAIILGSLIGSLLLAFVGRMGQIRGQNSAQLMSATFGNNFAKLPIILNIVQLIGWTAFELVIMSEGMSAILTSNFAVQNIDNHILKAAFILIFGALIIFLISKPMTGLVRKFIAKFALPLVLLSLLWLSYQFIGKINFNEFWNKPGSGMGFFSALDLVIAMPISWLPLIADYSRFGKSAKGTMAGTLLGYFIANIWCYSLGLIIVSNPQQAENFLGTILLAQGGLIALGLILFDELDNAYGDTYSGGVSLSQIFAKINDKIAGFIILIISAICAIFLPMHDLEKFLIILSSVFIPMFAVILGANCNLDTKIIWKNSIVWVLGILIFHSIGKIIPNIGASLPCFAICFCLSYFLNRKH